MQNSHRIIQLALKNALAPKEVWLERSFPQISRIADVVLPSQKIIFEIQCSPISAQEVRARISDYKSAGYTVIWILHDLHFNRVTLTPAERLLRSHTHYFTNMNPFGYGEIYDQYAPILRGRRTKRTPRYPITLNHFISLKQIPRHFPKERRSWRYSFKGDLFHQPFQFEKQSPFRFYHILFQSLIEKISSR